MKFSLPHTQGYLAGLEAARKIAAEYLNELVLAEDNDAKLSTEAEQAAVLVVSERIIKRKNEVEAGK